MARVIKSVIRHTVVKNKNSELNKPKPFSWKLIIKPGRIVEV